MYNLSIAEETFICNDVELIKEKLNHRVLFAKFFSQLNFIERQDRSNGIRFEVEGKKIYGTSEVWLQPHLDGTLLHFFLHASLIKSNIKTRGISKLLLRLRIQIKQYSFLIKQNCETGRIIGCGRG